MLLNVDYGNFAYSTKLTIFIDSRKIYYFSPIILVPPTQGVRKW